MPLMPINPGTAESCISSRASCFALQYANEMDGARWSLPDAEAGRWCARFSRLIPRHGHLPANGAGMPPLLPAAAPETAGRSGPLRSRRGGWEDVEDFVMRAAESQPAQCRAPGVRPSGVSAQRETFPSFFFSAISPIHRAHSPARAISAHNPADLHSAAQRVSFGTPREQSDDVTGGLHFLRALFALCRCTDITSSRKLERKPDRLAYVRTYLYQPSLHPAPSSPFRCALRASEKTAEVERVHAEQKGEDGLSGPSSSRWRGSIRASSRWSPSSRIHIVLQQCVCLLLQR